MSPPARAAEPSQSEPTPRSEQEPSGNRRALATTVAVFPGILVHGAGSWVLGDERTAKRLLILEGVGVGALAGGIAGAAVTGAARSLVGVFIATGMGGLSLFTLSFALDLYRVTSPEGGLGEPRRTPFLESQLGYLYVNDPVFSYRHFLHHGLRLQPGRIGLEFEGFHSPLEGNSRLMLSPSVRVWHPPAGVGTATEGSYLDVAFAATRHQFETEGFSTNTFEVELASRVDSQRIVPGLYGAFSEFALGYAWRETRFPRFSVSSHDTLLLGGFGVGVYLGEAAGRGGEVRLWYDHRHDDFAAGLKSEGLGSGVLGHLGIDAHYYLGRHLGVTATAQAGSALVLGAGLTFRQVSGPSVPIGR